jgi:hypothetical protein
VPKRKVNKSEAIREQFQLNPKARASEIVETLGKKGIDVKPGLVYMIKGGMMQRKSHKRQKAARVAQAGQKSGMPDPLTLLLKTKELAKEAGGIDNLKTLVGILAD